MSASPAKYAIGTIDTPLMAWWCWRMVALYAHHNRDVINQLKMRGVQAPPHHLIWQRNSYRHLFSSNTSTPDPRPSAYGTHLSLIPCVSNWPEPWLRLSPWPGFEQQSSVTLHQINLVPEASESHVLVSKFPSSLTAVGFPMQSMMLWTR